MHALSRPPRASLSDPPGWRLHAQGRYDELNTRGLSIRLVERSRFGNLIDIDEVTVPLIGLAAGSVQQEVLFTERDGRSTIQSYRCNFHIYFQERFTYPIRFVEWRCANLRATDDAGTSDPFIKFSIRGTAPSTRTVLPSTPPLCACRNVIGTSSDDPQATLVTGHEWAG